MPVPITERHIEVSLATSGNKARINGEVVYFPPGLDHSLLSRTVCDMKTVAENPLFTVPAGKVLRIDKVVVHSATASLAGGTDYDIGNIGTLDWKTAVNLSTITTAVLSLEVPAGATVLPTFAAGVTISIKPITGSTLAANATVELYGTLHNA